MTLTKYNFKMKIASKILFTTLTNLVQGVLMLFFGHFCTDSATPCYNNYHSVGGVPFLKVADASMYVNMRGADEMRSYL